MQFSIVALVAALAATASASNLPRSNGTSAYYPTGTGSVVPSGTGSTGRPAASVPFEGAASVPTAGAGSYMAMVLAAGGAALMI